MVNSVISTAAIMTISNVSLNIASSSWNTNSRVNPHKAKFAWLLQLKHGHITVEVCSLPPLDI